MITINMQKAVSIAHNIRRQKRAEEFAPLDIKVTIPGQIGIDAELARQEIRARYAQMQLDLDAATTPEQLKAILLL